MTTKERRQPVGWTLLVVLLAGSAALAAAPVARADEPVPQADSPCSAELADAMTLLADGTTYVVCEQSGPDYAWTPVQTPFPPNERWLSYGPPISLHGQAMRNPNLASGRWTATPRNPQTVCRVTQTTVVEAGVLAPPDVTESEQGKPLSVELKQKLFYVELAGDCLWGKD